MVGEAVHEVPVEACTSAPAPLGDSGRTVQVLRYLPHATVGADNQIVNVSAQAINPAVEIAIAGD